MQSHKKHSGDVPFFTHDTLSELSHVKHAFFGNQGGVSTGVYESLNIGYGSNDDRAAITENRVRAMRAMGTTVEQLCTIYQIHSANVEVIDIPREAKDAMEGDAMVTDKPGIVLGIMTADCAPVLFADNKHNVIGAAHAGWKGARGGVLKSTVEAMELLGAKRSRIHAVIGPCIKQSSYEVSDDFLHDFIQDDDENNIFFTPAPRDEHYLFDLTGYVQRKLERLGVNIISSMPYDTKSESTHFFSYRRKTLNNEPDYGRQLSAIMLG